MKSVLIREGRPEDVPAALQLVKELAAYEKAPDEVINTEAAMLEDGFGENPSYGMYVAEAEGSVVGIAIHYIRYSTWKGKTLYLEDIVVREAMRGQGIGALLFQRCLEHALEHELAGMVWQVLDWNEPAFRFYNKYHASYHHGWVTGSIARAKIQEMKANNYEDKQL